MSEKVIGSKSFAEMLASLQRDKPQAEGFTTREICEAANINIRSLTDILRRAIAAKQVEYAGKKYVTCNDGVDRLSPCYRLVKRKK